MKQQKKLSLGILSAFAIATAGTILIPSEPIEVSASPKGQWSKQAHPLYEFNKEGYAVKVGTIPNDKLYFYDSALKTVKRKNSVSFYQIKYNGKHYLLQHKHFWQDFPKG